MLKDKGGRGAGGEESDSDEELVQWTKALDFDTYINDWKSMATTANSGGALTYFTPCPL